MKAEELRQQIEEIMSECYDPDMETFDPQIDRLLALIEANQPKVDTSIEEREKEPEQKEETNEQYTIRKLIEGNKQLADRIASLEAEVKEKDKELRNFREQIIRASGLDGLDNFERQVNASKLIESLQAEVKRLEHNYRVVCDSEHEFSKRVESLQARNKELEVDNKELHRSLDTYDNGI